MNAPGGPLCGIPLVGFMGTGWLLWVMPRPRAQATGSGSGETNASECEWKGWNVPFYRLFYAVSKYGPAMRHRWLFRGHMNTVGSFGYLPGVMDSISPFVPHSTRVGNNH